MEDNQTLRHTRCNKHHSEDRRLSPIRMVTLQLMKQQPQ